MTNVLFSIFVMAGVTYLIRVLPLTLFRKKIKNKFVRSFLYYVPYVTLSVMIFPAILDATKAPLSALVGFIVAIVFAYKEMSLIHVAMLSCLSVFIVELFLY